MILYNITISVDASLAKAWVDYMHKEHIPAVLNTGHFRDFKLCRVEGDEQGGLTFAWPQLILLRFQPAKFTLQKICKRWGQKLRHLEFLPIIRRKSLMDVRAKKHLGQHFLTGPGIAQRIAESITLHNGCNTVLEVGPGTGALTKPLIARGDLDLHVIELDEESVDYLITEEVLKSEQVHGVDLLKWNPNLAFPNGAPFIVAGNFPYNISSQILFWVLDKRNRVPEVVGMFQKEVAERVAEGPGSKTYGILSVLLQSYYDIEYLFTVHEDAFDPPPKVKSGVIRLQEMKL